MDRGRDDLARLDQVGDEALVDLQITFVLPTIAKVMAPGQHPPHLGAETEGVWKHLKHDISVCGAIPGSVQRREA